MLNYIIRKATLSDLDNICKFVDWWLSGKAFSEGFTSGGKDWFVPRNRHVHFILDYITLIAVTDSEIVGWAVKQKNGSLIHLLIAGDCRGYGIGSSLVKAINPSTIRSKCDQSTGNPRAFYKKLGFSKLISRNIGRHKNIEILSRE